MPRLPIPPRARLLVPLGTATASLLLFATLSRPLHADAPPTPSHPKPAKSFPGIPFEPRDKAPAGGPKVPKGGFLDENGKPCSSCNSFSDWMKKGGPTRAAGSSSSSSKSGETKTKPAAAAAAMAAATAASFGGERSEAELREMRADCPPDIEELGRATWTFLHTTVSALPDNPSATEQTALANLLLALPVLYPCPHCRADFALSVSAAGGEAAVREAVQSRSSAERWVWERHEEVNRKLGKEGGVQLEKVRERWRDGPADGRCDMAW